MFMGYGHWLPTPSFSERCLDAPAFSDDFTDFKQLSCFGMSEKKVLERDESYIYISMVITYSHIWVIQCYIYICTFCRVTTDLVCAD